MAGNKDISEIYMKSSPSSVKAAAKLLQLAGDNIVTWRTLSISSKELHLDYTLPTGQSFRWRRTGDIEYTGVIGNRVVKLRQDEDEVLYQVLARGEEEIECNSNDESIIREYFNLSPSTPEIPSSLSRCDSSPTTFSQLSEYWAARDQRFAAVRTYFPGARMLRQDPLECLFSFICSSNNNISRIHSMVEKLCSTYGTPLLLSASSDHGKRDLDAQADSSPHTPLHSDDQDVTQDRQAPLSFYAFPNLDQLAVATEEELRNAGFGYRAKFITGSVQALRERPERGREWLLSLRDVPYEEAAAALCTLPGIGPKVAACVSLFSLDKHNAIPVDTHVWDIATKYYMPGLKGKSLTKNVHEQIQKVFEDRFGPFCGWAHNTLFMSELASQRQRLPEKLGGTTNALSTKAPAVVAKKQQPSVKRRKIKQPEFFDDLN
ncbi:hypothetical protein CEUSTIGMA_g11155.t1 [Chlamydomonas eustigma]|uniref:DNA-(apurinic or apyrimidinic site) lyase n=1 Tax=Chlamydomonas eustigma TaxID=1157962 RepID=A0A250XLS0_9CHLO|nr:hypothetical protein CEUSTIGMA_g11155.t1 [Chlamydomonas eustigma]|eukprot:GAX83730.1 hypothetical protein CEUSTIGMA_g11155.t1 [Chlamydomonas eustigma]